MDLKVLIEPHVDLPRLSRYLDELGHPGRLYAVQSWGRNEQAALYEAAKGFRKVTLDHYVPPGTEPLREVIHHGRNTLPVATRFQKRFCLPREEQAKDKLWGYNHQTFASFTGPGYFVTHPSQTEGEVDIDYTMLPNEKPDSWPSILPNSAKLGRFVYAKMVDVMRGISDHVSIGRATRGGKESDAWFILVREDPTPPS